MIARVADAERARRAHVVEVARAQELGAHDADQRHPAEQQHQAEQPPEARRDDAGEDDQEVERRHARPDLDEALQDEVDPAAEVALHRAGGDADDRAEDGQGQAEEHRECGSRRSAAPRRRAPGRRCRASSARSAATAPGPADRAPPCRSCRGSAARPSSPCSSISSCTARVAVVGLGLEEAAEGGLRIGDEDGEVEAAVVADEQRLVVGDQLGAQADQQQRREDPQRPAAAPVGAEVRQAAAIERAETASTVLDCPPSRSRCADRPARR